MSRRPGERWGQFAARIADAFGIVLLMVGLAYTLLSLAPYKGWTGALDTFVGTAAAVIGLASSGVRPLLVRGAAALGAIAVALAAVSAIADEPRFLGASFLILALLILVAAGAILRTVLAETEVGFRTILGAISVYTLLGLLFTFLYGALERIQSDSFFSSGAPGQGDFVYFSFTTLTTTGFGDLVPAGQPGKMFAGLEMLIGNIFLVTLVAGLVSLWRPGRRRGGTAGGRDSAVRG